MAGTKTASVTHAMNHSRDSDAAPESTGSLRPAGGQGMNQGVQVLSYLIAGIGIYGFLGWLVDHFLGTGFWLPVGIVAGAALSIYVVIRRFSTEPDLGSGPVPHGTTTKTRGRV